MSDPTTMTSPLAMFTSLQGAREEAQRAFANFVSLHAAWVKSEEEKDVCPLAMVGCDVVHVEGTFHLLAAAVHRRTGQVGFF